MNNICNVCGANYEYKDGKWICPACGAIKEEELTNEEVVLLADASKQLRLANFDYAEELFTDFIKKYPKNSEGYWFLLLTKYGIKYEDDLDGKKIPTIYATSIESVLDDKYYKKAIELADKDKKKYYKEEAEKFEKIRKEWVEKASKQKPFDIFICFKDSDKENGIERTDDSYEANNLYNHLKDLGYNVFFSRETLRDKVAEKYEPYIFNALNTSHVMVIYSTCKEYVESTWVKNEWNRFLKKIKNGEKQPNSLVLAFDKFNPSELKGFSSVQCMDANKKTFYGDLEKHIAKVIKEATKPKAQIERIEIKSATKKTAKNIKKEIEIRELGTYKVEQLTADFESKQKTALKFLSKGLFEEALQYFDEILDKNPNNNVANCGKILAQNNCINYKELIQNITDFSDLSLLETYIAYSNKEDATDILHSLENIVINDVKNKQYENIYHIVDFALRYKYENSKILANITDINSKLYENNEYDLMDKINDVILMHYSENTDDYLKHLEYYIEFLNTKALYDSSNKYCNQYFEISPQNSNVIWLSIRNDLCSCNDNEVAKNIYKFNNNEKIINLLESVTTKSQRKECIYKIFNIINNGYKQTKNNAEDYSRVFDELLKFTEEKDEKVVDYIYEFAQTCQINREFNIAEKYYSILINENGNSHEYYWKLLQCKLKSRNNDDLIKQPTIISSLPEFQSAIVAAGDDVAADKYIDIKVKQNEYIENQKKQEEIHKKRKKRRIIASTILGVIVICLLSTFVGVYLRKEYVNSQSKLLYAWSDDYNGYVVKAGLYYNDKQISIPTYYNNKRVIAIDEYAFKNKSVEIITIPNSLLYIGDYAFDGCDNLALITFTDEITYASDSSYSNSNLRIVFAAENEITTSEPQLKRIGNYAFRGCGKLSIVNLPNSVEYIGEYAFSNCTNLKEFKIPSSLTIIEKGTFENSFLTTESSISIPSNIDKIEKDAFKNCANLKNIYIDERNSIPTDWDENWYGEKTNSTIKYSLPLHFDYQGATNNNNVEKISVVYNENYQCPTPIKAGYSFDGWYEQPNGLGEKYALNNGQSIEKWNLTSGLTIYANWVANTNSIIFNGNGATSGEMANQQIKTDETRKLDKCNYTRLGYNFLGWSTTPNGNIVYLDEVNYTMGTNSTYTLYAVWEANTNEVIFNGNGATSGEMPNQQIKTDETKTLNANVFVKTGYHLAGWSTTPNGNVEYLDSASYTMGPIATYTLYAVWEITIYNITYNLNGGTANNISNYNINTETFILKNPNREGYTFIGWTGSNGNTPQENVSIECGSFGNKQFIANYEANTNSIIFNGNGATSGEMSSQQIKTDETKTLNNNIYTKDDYVFIGWSTTSNGEVEYVDGANYIMGPNSTYTLYAVWDYIYCIVKYNGNGATSGDIQDVYVNRYESSSYALLENVYEKTGYTFKGWGLESQTNTYINNYDIKNNYNVTFYAQWQANTNSIIFNGNGATSGEMSSQQIRTDETKTLNANSFKKTGYLFIGWSTTLNGEVEYANGANYTMGTNSTYTLYAVWEEKVKNINDINDLKSIQNDLQNGVDYNRYLLNNSITIDENWNSIGYGVETGFDKIFDGQGHTIYFNISTQTYGLFYLNKGTIKNLKIDNNVNFTNANHLKFGALVSENAGNIENCSSVGDINININTQESALTGGYYSPITGHNYNNILNCYSLTNINVTGYRNIRIGGVAGQNSGLIQNCFSNGDMSTLVYTTTSMIGGITAISNTGSKIRNSFSLSPMLITDQSNGVGSNYYIDAISAYGEKNDVIENCYYWKNQSIRCFQYNEYYISTNDDKLPLVENFNEEIYSAMNFKQFVSFDDMKINSSNVWKRLDDNYPILWYETELVLNGNDADDNDIVVISAIPNENIILNNCFEKTGYTFIGWSTTQDGEVEYVDGASYAMGTNSTYNLYAVWQINQYTLTIDTNGGTECANITQDYNSLVYSPTTTRLGYTFDEWYEDSNFTKVFSFATMPAKNMTIYAKWNSDFNSTSGFIGIRTAEEFVDINTNINGNFILEKDIDFSSYSFNNNTYRLFENFSGVIDGDKHSIIGFTRGLVYNLYGTLKNISFTNINLHNVLGGISLIYQCKDSCLIDNITVSGQVWSSSEFCGGIATYGKNIKNSTTNISLSFSKPSYGTYSMFYGGIVGLATGNIDNCHSNIIIKNIESITSSTMYFGGIAGAPYGSSTISNCYSYYDNQCSSSNKCSDIVGFANFDFDNDLIDSVKLINCRTSYNNSKLYGGGAYVQTVDCDTTLSQSRNYFVSELNWSEDIWCFGYGLPRHYTNNDIKIKYHLNGGINNDSNKSAYILNGDDVILYSPTRNGYTFDGWYTDELFTNKITKISNISRPIDIYAKWIANKYSVTLNTVGGTISNSNVQLTFDSNYTLEVPTRAGYKFLGWYNGTGNSAVQFTDNNGNSLAIWDITTTYVLYAKWEANTNMIILSDGQGNTVNLTGKTDEYVRLPANTFEKENYEFAGWSTTQDGDIVYYDQDLYEVGPNSSYTLYAVFNTKYSDYTKISTKEDLANILNNLNGKYYLANDIDCEYEYLFGALKTTTIFRGVLDGCNHSIYNLKISSSHNVEQTDYPRNVYNKRSIFYCNYGTIKDLSFINCFLSDYSDLNSINTVTFNRNEFYYNYTETYAILCQDNYGSISNCYFEMDNKFSVRYDSGSTYNSFNASIGSITHTNNGNIVDCSVLANIDCIIKNKNGQSTRIINSFNINFGGICFTNNSTISNCYTYLSGSYFTNNEKHTNGMCINKGDNSSILNSSKVNQISNLKICEKKMLIKHCGDTCSIQWINGHYCGSIFSYKNTNKDGYTFVGWSESVNNQTIIEDDLYFIYGQKYKEIYAVWEANTNEVIFNGNGATSGEMSNQQIKTGEVKSLNSNLYQKSGYHFIGWSTTSNGQVEYVDGANYTMGTNSAYTLYAVWEANTNTIEFIANNGTNQTDSQTGLSDTTITLKQCSFNAVDGYYFAGWSTTQDGEVEYLDGANFAIGKAPLYTLYAVWKEIN